MNRGIREKPQPFDSFKEVLRVLQVAGYCKLFNPRNRYTEICHKVYRVIVVFIVCIYTLQHSTHCVMMYLKNDNEKLLDAIVLTIPEIILCRKVFTMFQIKRLDKLDDLIKDPMFAANNKQDEEYIKDNNIRMQRLSKFCTTSMCFVAGLWMIAPIFQRMNDESTVVPSYLPFELNTWPRFLIAQFLDTSTVLWIGFGHINMDCLIATYYAQVQLQLKIIKHNLEHLFDRENYRIPLGRGKNGFQYLDVVDRNVQPRFVHYVNRYERVAWFSNEITSIFNGAISFQFFFSSFSTCLVVYQMSTIDVNSVQFAFLVGYYMVVQFEVFLFCQYGGLIEYESKFVSDSFYLGEWLSLSPRFRRQVVIAMARWTVPITPRVSNIVPLSLTTFVSITRSAYTLYTVLKNKNNRVEGERTLAF